jgi:hypothetical protein
MIARSFKSIIIKYLKSRTDVPKVSNEYPKFQKASFSNLRTPLTSFGKVSLSVHN